MPNLVPQADVSSAVALNNAERHVATIIGPSVAGLVLILGGAGWCYLADALSWFAMLGALLLIARPLQLGLRGRISVSAIGDGLRFVWGQPVILSFMILDFGATLFGLSRALLPVYARDILEIGPGGLGLLYAAPSVGALLAAGVMSSARVTRVGRWVLLGVAFYGACVVGFSVSRVLVVSLVMLAGTGIGDTVSSVLRSTSNQLLTPDPLRGRVAALNSVFARGGPQLGQFESGLVASLFTPQISALTGGLGTLLLAGGIAFVPMVRRFDLRTRDMAGTNASSGSSTST